MENADAKVSRKTVRVLLPLPLSDAYDYSVPEGVEVAPGHFVVVPLGKRETLGVVWGGGTGEVATEKLRDVIEVPPALPMADALRRFIDWVSAYTLSPPGAVLRMALGSTSALEAPRTELVYRPSAAASDDTLKLTAARRRVLAALKDGPAMPIAELAHLAGVGTSVVKAMASAGLLESLERTVRRSFPQPDGTRDGPSLSPEQKVRLVQIDLQWEGPSALITRAPLTRELGAAVQTQNAARTRFVHQPPRIADGIIHGQGDDVGAVICIGVGRGLTGGGRAVAKVPRIRERVSVRADRARRVERDRLADVEGRSRGRADPGHFNRRRRVVLGDVEVARDGRRQARKVAGVPPPEERHPVTVAERRPRHEGHPYLIIR